MRLKRSIIAIAVILLIGVGSAYAVDLPAMPQNYVVDLAGIVNESTESQLNAYLQELEQKTTAQVIVLTIRSLEGNDLEEFSLSVAHDRWKLGQKGKDNGTLILVSLEDRKYRIEVGYGLEGILPDSLVGSIGRQQMVPRFKQGDYSGGIAAATIVIANIIAKESGVEIAGMPAVTYQRRPQNEEPGIVFYVIALLFFIGFVYMFIKHPRLMILFLLTSGSGRGSSWGGGGGFGGGSFGGGGGGGFGGGGASGGW